MGFMLVDELDGKTTLASRAPGSAAGRAGRRPGWAIAAWVLASVLLCLLAYRGTRARALDEARGRAERQASAFGLALQNEIDKFETLPFVMSLHPQVAQALSDPADAARIRALNLYLAEVQKRSLISAAFAIDASGLTVAASNWNLPSSFMGQNYRFRPYLQEALDGGTGRFYGIGSTSGEPGYFLAYPVYAVHPTPGATPAARPVGAVVIKIDLSGFERYWTSSDDTVALVDANGIVFLGNLPALKYRSLQALGEAVRHRIEASRQYPGQALDPLPAGLLGQGRPAAERVSRPVGKLGWQLMLSIRAGQADAAARNAALGAALLACVAGLVAHALHQRREHRRTSVAARQALNEASAQLEQRIALRTGDLVRANEELRQRYRELQEAEQLLRRTQGELVQAGKLGMLGQMAAGMTHELNQPLAAMQAFADNAVSFIDRDDVASARENLGHISDACARMGAIIRQLKGFASKSDGAIGPVDLTVAIHNSARLVASDYTQRGATLSLHLRETVRVMGHSVRVEQVLINLMRNALDAVEATEARHVRLALTAEPPHAVVRVVDTGPGISAQVLERLFEPFFTTKAPGRGMGLGLAISSSIVQAMDGELLADNAPEGGAEFTLRLPLLDTGSATAPTTQPPEAGSP